MDNLSIFDVIGPNMVGPSSSHTAGAVLIGRMAWKMFRENIKSVQFTLYGSFAKTYKGHGTDRALLGGILGFGTDDLRIRDSFHFANTRNIKYKFITDNTTVVDHPNTVDVQLTGVSGKQMTIRGESVGGGKIIITRINRIHVEFTGEYSTLIVRQDDKPGVVAYITQCLAEQNVNIAFMRLFREKKGFQAYTVVESDELIPEDILEKIRENRFIHEILLIQL